MRSHLLFLLAMAASAPAATHAATPGTQWSAFTTAPRGGALMPGRYAGEIALNGQLAAADAQGNLFVVATERYLDAPCLVLVKYAASTGSVSWRREACGDRHTWGAALAVDRAGDVVVTGSVSGALRTIKYAGASGAVLWDQRPASAGAEAGFGIATAPNGDAIVAAHTAGITTDVKVVRYRAGDGAPAWERVVDAGFDELPAGIGVDARGDVVVAASFANDRGDGDWLLHKLDGASGETLWEQRYDSGRRDIPAALAVDAAGNAVVAGASALAGGGFALRTVMYASDGRLAWDRSTGAGASGARAVAIDGRGNVVVAGQVEAAAGDTDLATIKYAADGTQRWGARFGSSGTGIESAHALALDPAGNVAITGKAFGAAGRDPEFVTVKYLGQTGAEMWSHAHRAPGASPETAGHAVVAAAGSTYAVGISQEGGPLGLKVMKLANALAAAPQAQANVQGLWWASPPGSESGWGVNLVQQGAILFATWFTYDADGEGAWFVMPRGERQDDGGYAGTLYRTRGPAFDRATFDPAQVSATAVGTAAFAFPDGENGTFRYALEGVTGEKAITRQVYATPTPECAAGGAAGAAPNYQDLWWAAPAGSESGWGLNVTHQGDVLFITWFTYAADGRALWLVGSRFERTGNGTYAGVLHRAWGPHFAAGRFDASRVRSAPVGTATLAFSDASNGVFSYSVQGTSGSKAITRQVFAEPQTVCR